MTGHSSHSPHLGTLKGHLDVSTLDCECEPGPLVLDKVKSNLGVPLLLKVGDDGLTAERAALDHRDHGVVPDMT